MTVARPVKNVVQDCLKKAEQFATNARLANTKTVKVKHPAKIVMWIRIQANPVKPPKPIVCRVPKINQRVQSLAISTIRLVCVVNKITTNRALACVKHVRLERIAILKMVLRCHNWLH